MLTYRPPYDGFFRRLDLRGLGAGFRRLARRSTPDARPQWPRKALALRGGLLSCQRGPLYLRSTIWAALMTSARTYAAKGTKTP